MHERALDYLAGFMSFNLTCYTLCVCVESERALYADSCSPGIRGAPGSLACVFNWFVDGVVVIIPYLHITFAPAPLRLLSRVHWKTQHSPQCEMSLSLRANAASKACFVSSKRCQTLRPLVQGARWAPSRSVVARAEQKETSSKQEQVRGCGEIASGCGWPSCVAAARLPRAHNWPACARGAAPLLFCSLRIDRLPLTPTTPTTFTSTTSGTAAARRGASSLGAQREGARARSRQEGPPLAPLPSVLMPGGDRICERLLFALACSSWVVAVIVGGAGGVYQCMRQWTVTAACKWPPCVQSTTARHRRHPAPPLHPPTTHFQVGSFFEFAEKNPIFGVIQPDSPLWAPILGLFAITGIPTAGAWGLVFFGGGEG